MTVKFFKIEQKNIIFECFFRFQMDLKLKRHQKFSKILVFDTMNLEQNNMKGASRPLILFHFILNLSDSIF